MIDTHRLISRRRLQDRVFNVLGIVCMLLGVVTLGALLLDLAANGGTRIDWAFLTSFPSRKAANAGVLSAWVGSLLLMLVTISLAVPLGVAAGVYLEEYARKNWVTTIIEINIANLAGVPSIIYGLLALGLLVYQFHLGQTIIVGGVTLAFLVLPIVIVSTREALRAIPKGIREAAYALGATPWQVIKDHLLPYS
ncbi:MAG TPA: phosphate ABC transporter permease PstA, partial [Planctomycetaceae bacterium]